MQPYPGQTYIVTRSTVIQTPKGPVTVPLAGHLRGSGPKRIETLHKKIAKDRNRYPKASIPGGARRFMQKCAAWDAMTPEERNAVRREKGGFDEFMEPVAA